jgi:hypothetical protein
LTPALTPGVAGTASNSQCTLDAGSSSVSVSGNDLTLDVALVDINARVVGAKNVYLYAGGISGQSSGWVRDGMWTPVDAPATIVSLSPGSGAGSSVTFTAVFSDPYGAGDLRDIDLVVNTTMPKVESASVFNTCMVVFFPPSSLYLLTDSGVLRSPLTAGEAGTVSNSECTLNAGLSSVSMSGNNMTLSVALSFTSKVVGSQNLYLDAFGYEATNTGWVTEGTWTPNPIFASLSPAMGAGTSVTFQAIYTDPFGAGDLSELLLQVNKNQASAYACYIYYQPQGNHLYLANDQGNAWITPALTPGVAGTASNSQCTLDAGSSSVTTAGNNLTLNAALTFSGTFVGEKGVYLYAVGGSGGNTGWVIEGTWTP